jgi:DNA-binding MarR family transcriptional regulator
MHLTLKQIELLSVIGKRNPDGGATDLDQILERLSYKPTKQSLQFSIRALIAHALIQKDAPEKRRGRVRTLISLTKTGEAMIGTKKSAPSFVVDVELDEMLSETTEFLEP